jgi:hypothetical protein
MCSWMEFFYMDLGIVLQKWILDLIFCSCFTGQKIIYCWIRLFWGLCAFILNKDNCVGCVPTEHRSITFVKDTNINRPRVY